MVGWGWDRGKVEGGRVSGVGVGGWGGGGRVGWGWELNSIIATDLQIVKALE